ncbi:MAG: 2,3-bisphosphoglycerate-independent phosphoglycerate mutase [Oscillospiraceae bacterium]|nr:2,3-bisphosphoglycerate-independent phosphoglycerate mutase [Oscillospiraceae bacterium]
MQKPVMLLILDGYGYTHEEFGNAVLAADTPYLDRLFKTCPHTLLGASGMDVGLPEGQMGNSEVGHTNIGAGRVVYQDLTRITKAIDDGDFYRNTALIEAVENSAVEGRALHLMGLLSDGGVHSHINHLFAAVRLAKKKNVKRLYVHCILDGRDVSPHSGKGFIEQLESELKSIGLGEIATVTGRYYAMDRDNRWERVEKAYAAFVYGEGALNNDAAGAVQESYDSGVTDEFVIPVVVNPDGQISAHDSVVFFNFRPDRAREITRTFVDPEFDGFKRKKGFFPLHYVCMTEYDESMPNVITAFAPQSLANTFGEYISASGLTQLRIAETEKYAHVTFFFNGGIEKPYVGEDRCLIDSPKVATYDLKPEMSAYEVADEAVSRVKSGKYDVIILNFANCDMVGHTGIFDAAKAAVEAVDRSVGKVVDAVLEAGGICLLTADHGNAEKMYEPDKSPFTAHSTNPVVFVVIGKDCKLKDGGRLSDIAPIMLQLLNLPQPREMEGASLIE